MRTLVGTALLVLGTATAAQAQISQQPLFLGGGNVPGNLLLVPSVEWPTINSLANLGPYDPARRYAGYFDAGRCYIYVYDAVETLRHFSPVATPAAPNCTGEFWSGNYLNWAATQTIDPFRLALTGGLRVRDTPTETWLEKARYSRQGDTGIFPNRNITGSTVVQQNTPGSWSDFRTRTWRLGNRLHFSSEPITTTDPVDYTPVPYNPAVPLAAGTVYEVSVRVRVCDAALGAAHLAANNCRSYRDGWKPEGLIQQYADAIRFSVFGFLNDPNVLRDGGVLRAQQKFVGPTQLDPLLGEIANPGAEWDPVTGVLYANPDPDDAASTSIEFDTPIARSGVINYLNQFGQQPEFDHKNFDPVSELYYAALRYVKNQGNVAAYSSMEGASTTNKRRFADGFPVITNWNDPIQYSCQKNVILGIGDTNTHRDKNLPGNTDTIDEPAMPPEVAADNTVNVVTATAKVAELEGITINTPFTRFENSAYIAGLAYDANTTDLRPDLPGRQSASTYWVDVREAQTLQPRARNQYWLAAKYGGFTVPRDYDAYARTTALPVEWWHTTGDVLATGDLRPDNFFVASEAQLMVDSLTEAFAAIVAAARGSASSVAANSTRLETETAIYQALFDSSNWSGDLLAFRINAGGQLSAVPAWSAAARLDALSAAQIGTRNVLTAQPLTSRSDGSLRSTSGIEFRWPVLAASQQTALRQSLGGTTPVTAAVGEQRVDYLRGSRADEISAVNPSAPFRQRGSRLSDIVNSNPQFIHKQDFGYATLQSATAFAGTTAGPDYITFRQQASYQNRPPLVVVGANDGMLHGFDASLDGSGGRELFAFVPNGALNNLFELTLPNYVHRYYVDGTPRVADAWLGSDVGWRTIAAGTTGAGGRSVFALDVTNPAGVSAGNVLWEFSHPDMGLTIGQPAIVALPNGRFGVVVTSGYDTAGSGGAIWFLDAANGSIIHRINVPNSGQLGSPLVVDLNRNRVADRVYIGDSNGNLWRFDLPGSNTSNWRAPQNLRSGGGPLPLFIAGSNQPITAPLTSAFNLRGEHMVLFGTGSFIRVEDNVVEANPADRAIQSFYGIVDRGVQIPDRTGLQRQEIITEQVVNGIRVRGVSDNQITTAQQGWYIDLQWATNRGGPGPRGERVVSRAIVRGDRVIFSTLIPSEDPCDFGGDSYIMELNTFSGSRLFYAVFDLDGDGRFDESDFIEVVVDGQTIRIPASGIAPGVGIISTPAVITGVGENMNEIKCVAGSSGALVCIAEAAAFGPGRQSWQQLR